MSLYPFTAIVDQERLVQALLINAVNPAVGGVLVEGPSGTGKSTAVRGLAELLPEIEVVADCPFLCDPAGPCPACRERVARGERLGSHRRRVRVVDLPLNATEDRVAGSVDIARALREGVMALEPGLLAEANRGILYVDEINLLDDHLCDVLLDAAALGVNVVEREGVSVSHPARFLLVGTMNPEEGDLRPQLADRIGLRVVVEALGDISRRAEVIRRREAFTADPSGFAAVGGRAGRLAERIADARERMGEVSSRRGSTVRSRVSWRAGVSSHRATSRCSARRRWRRSPVIPRSDGGPAGGGRARARSSGTDRPVRAVPGIDERLLRRVLDDVLEQSREKKRRFRRRRADAPLTSSRRGPASWSWSRSRACSRAPSRPDRLERGAIGRRERSLVALRRGKYSRHGSQAAVPRRAFDATLRAAAARAGRQDTVRLRREDSGARCVSTGSPSRSASSSTTATRCTRTVSSSR